MNEQQATKHLAECGVEIHMHDRRSPETIADDMITRGVIPPLEVLEKDGMTLAVDELIIFERRSETMSVEQKVNC